MSASLVYVKLGETIDRSAITVLRTSAGPAVAEHSEQLNKAIETFLERSVDGARVSMADPVGPRTLYLSATPLGLESEYGVIVTASSQETFPTSTERLLLDVAANQASVVLQHVRAHAALRSSESHFRTMADHAPALLWVTDATGACTYLSKQWYEFTGRTPEKDLGAGWLENAHPEDVDHATEVFLSANAKGVPFSVDYRLRRQDGEYRWVVDSGLPRFDERHQFQGFVGAVIDVHDRRAGEGRLRLLWEAASVLLTTDDPDAMIRGLFANVSRHLDVDTYLNYVVDDGGGALNLVSCSGVPEEKLSLVQRLNFGEAICGTVARERTPMVAARIQSSDDPKVQLVKSFGIRAYACNPLLVDDRLIGTLSFASRTKDEFKPEEIAFLETLSHYVTIAYERLRLVDRLKEADRRKDEFLATLAHELRNPLAPVRNASELLKRALGNEELTKQATSILDRQLSHMVHLIDDLLDVARITSGKLELRKSRVELSTVLMSAVEASRPLIESLGHELTLALPPPIFIHADAVRMAQVFANILINAAKYSDPGGRILLTAERDGADVVVRVKDTGVGISSDMLPRIFEMFTQVGRSLDRSQGGLGLGLTLVKQLTELHGGIVKAVSDGHGRGSEFTVRLPTALHPNKEDSLFVAKPTGGIEPLRIIVVDDNKDGAESLGILLRIQGHEVQLAHDGIEAVEIAESLRPDVMVLDIGLPGMSGYEVARHIRTQSWSAKLLIVAVSGWGQSQDKRRSQEAGIDYHLVKPVNPADLDRILAEGRENSHRSQRN